MKSPKTGIDVAVLFETIMAMNTMKNRFPGCALLLTVLILSQGLLGAADAAAAKPALKQFIYVLRLDARLQDEKAWTPEDKAAAARHFQHLKEATQRGQVILAGRTEESLDKTFGIVVFEATDKEVAQKFMESDPAVVSHIMKAELHPYSVALLRKSDPAAQK